jgi:hypothetical protein
VDQQNSLDEFAIVHFCHSRLSAGTSQAGMFLAGIQAKSSLWMPD